MSKLSMHRPSKLGRPVALDINRRDLRTWEKDPAAGWFRVGVWDQQDQAERWVSIEIPPSPWQHRDGVILSFLHPDGRSVIVTGSVQEDGRPWLHVSVARQNRMPSYKDLAEAKDLFIGPARQALQVFPEAGNHVNIHPYALHLWCCLVGDGLPDFTRGGASI